MKISEKISLQCEDTDFILDLFFRLLSELLKLSMQISNEFIDGNTVHRKDSKLLLSPESLKEYIFTNGLSNDEKKKRREYLKTEMADLLARQTALLAGYRNSIEYGVKDLLKELDPGIVMKKELEKSFNIGRVSIPQKYLPFIIYSKAFKNIVRIFASLNSEKNHDIKNKFFRPAFISGYLKSIHSDQEGTNIDSLFTEQSS
jgi:hypothetical protein